MLHHPFYKYAVFVTGILVHIITFIMYLFVEKDKTTEQLRMKYMEQLQKNALPEIKATCKEQLTSKSLFFNDKKDEKQIDLEANEWAMEILTKEVEEQVAATLSKEGKVEVSYHTYFQALLGRLPFIIVTFIPGILMYALFIIYHNVYVKYIFDRLIMTFFVIIGVIFFVFTLLYMSPLDPAANILGVTATENQIANFNRIHGLDKSYFLQLFDAIKGIFTFDLGLSFESGQDISESILRRFPITAQLALLSLIMSVVIAIPIGIISATRQNSFLDYSFMSIALLGLSIPNFWLGLIFILTFSINLQWFPAIYSPGNIWSMIMPVIALGTALAASIARMTRASVLEVIREDYILTARSKGLSSNKVLWRHIIPNAMIPIITLIGLQFGGMLGGAAITEKVFNVSGIGSFIVDKQFVPDIPSVMAGVVYVAITISLVNVIIDILYAFFDPRIRSKMKEY